LTPLKFPIYIATILATVFVSACSTIPPQTPSRGHIQTGQVRAEPSSIPPLVSATSSVPRPKPAAKAETYSVSVRNVPVSELLFALSRDAKLNIDLHPGIEGTVSINAIDQTLQQILTRLAKQVDMRWELNGPNLAIMPDSPFLRTYRIDYVNMSRDMAVKTEVSSQVGSAGAGGAGGGSTSIESKSNNHFWKTLDQNIQDLLRETDKVLPEGSSETVIDKNEQQTTSAAAAKGVAALAGVAPTTSGAVQSTGNTVVKRSNFREAAAVITNPEAGIISVRASSRQHEKIQEFLDQVMGSSRRQVMIEATIVEVGLTTQYDQGINWQSLRELRPGSTAGFSAAQRPTGTPVASPFAGASDAFVLNYVAPGLGVAATVSLLENFGNVKVLSSPKISVLNNQTAIIKVVDNLVYFTVKSDTTNPTTGTPITTLTTTPNSISVGVVMSITPQISENNTVLLNVRPVISRLNRRVTDPASALNTVPEIATREMESMLRLTDGETAVMGGLMSDELGQDTDGVPGLASLPGIGSFFTKRTDTTKKTELVIFLKPTIIREPSIYGDYRGSARMLPTEEFFSNNPGPSTRLVPAHEDSKP
jgi:MSHA biogenesis protein MshL